MNDITQEEQDLLCKLQKPVIDFILIENMLDASAQKKGYADHKDFLDQTGWFDRFADRNDDDKETM